MNKHRATRPTINLKPWLRYAFYRLALALINARTKAMAKALTTKPNTKPKQNRKRNK